MTQYILGLDPGLDGGAAVHTYDSQGGREELFLTAMPTMQAGRGKQELDIASLKTWILAHIPGLNALTLAVLELVGSRPQQGVASTFTFGTGFGELRGFLKWEQLPYEMPRPQAWKKVVLAGSGKEKSDAIALIKRRFPSVSLKRTQACRTDHDGMAEAACLALYGRHKLTGG